ncbi:flavodoxin domain-containing protein [Catenovulum sp. 2E275]|uniref:flavodoxin domain-containing protein n=1 Tax=Catenovulum sp. 2E275 TaxID=2980497 RepID=UPI0021D25169|nr:flavodoxin domain-containing protein [Catenovulum sp. 2E275]MCU4676962.1 flavodoxin domain-containing protein [Catenovulum sp. 2E275]
MSLTAILVGSVYGGAEDLAENTLKKFKQAGVEAKVFSDCSLADILAENPEHWLVITSTTGQGDVPDNLANVYFELKNTPNLTGQKYAVIAMGDSSYFDTFCQAGKDFDEVLAECMATQLQPKLEIDACETMDAVGAAQTWLDEFIAKLKV